MCGAGNEAAFLKETWLILGDLKYFVAETGQGEAIALVVQGLYPLLQAHACLSRKFVDTLPVVSINESFYALPVLVKLFAGLRFHVLFLCTALCICECP